MPSFPSCPDCAVVVWDLKKHSCMLERMQAMQTCVPLVLFAAVVVWDLKKQRPVISFKDPSG